MYSSKLPTLLFICMLLVTHICGKPPHKPKKGKSHHGKPIIKVPPITMPPITVPPVLSPPTCPSGKPSPPSTPTTPKAQPTCPINVLKLGACVDLLGGLIHIGIGDPTKHICCPILQGLAEVEAAICLCTTLKVKLLNLNIFVPLALQVLLTCGKNPPPGFTCTI